MHAAPFSQSWSWVVPLLAGDRVIGVLKIKQMHMGVQELKSILPTILRYHVDQLQFQTILDTLDEIMDDE